MKSWVKLYTEINHDPKCLTLTWAQRGIWTAIMALAGEIDVTDECGKPTGELDTIEYTAIRIRCDLTEFRAALATFIERGMVEERDGVLYLPNFATRQQRKPSDAPASINERVRQHREMKRACNADVTPLKRPVTRTDSDTDSDAYSDTDADAKSSSSSAPATRADDDDDDGFAARFAVVVKDWEKLNPRRQISALDAEFLQEMAKIYGCEAISGAIRAANKHGAISLAYIEQVLRNGHSPPSRASPSPPLTLPPEPPGLVWDGDLFLAQQKAAQQHANDQSNTIRPAPP